MKKPFKKSSAIRIKWTSMLRISILMCMLIAINSLHGQNTTHPLGAKLLPDSEYDSLPKISFTVLRANANNQAISTQSTTGIVMLDYPPVGDQGDQGSCVGWAVGYAATSILAYPKFSNDWNVAERSPSYIYNQIKVDPNDCESGAYTTSGLNLAKNDGVCSYTLMPYDEEDCTTQPDSTQDFDASLNTILSWGSLTKNSVSDIKECLDLGYPVVIAFKVYTSFDNMWNDDGIWDTENSGTYRGDHATCIIGYDDTQEMFKVQNSWGTSGGDNGCFWVTYDLVENNCLKEAYVLYGINQSVYPTLSGSSSLCASGADYSINNLPDGCTIEWASSTNISRSSSQGANPCTFSVINNGSGWVSATIVSSNSSYLLLEKNVLAGIQADFSGPSSILVGGSGTYTASITTCEDSTSSLTYQWWLREKNTGEASTVIGYGSPITLNSVSRSSTTLSSGISLRQPVTSTYYYLSLTVRDEYGSYTTDEQLIRAYGDVDLQAISLLATTTETTTIYLSTFPNPVDAEATISLETTSDETEIADNEEWSLEIYSNTQSLQREKSKIKGKECKINTSGWKEGIYILKATYNNEIITGKLIVNK